MRLATHLLAAVLIWSWAAPRSDAQILSIELQDTGTYAWDGSAAYPGDPPSDEDFASWGITYPASGGVRFSAVAAYDRDAFAINHGTVSVNPRYDLVVEILAQPNQCWRLGVRNALRGALIRCDDGSGGLASASSSGMQGKLPPGAAYSLISGSLTLPPQRNDGADGKMTIDDSVDGTIAGVGHQVVRISYLYSIQAISEVSFPHGGDEAIARFGVHVPKDGTKFGCYESTYGSENLTGEGHFITVDLDLGPSITAPAAPESVDLCEGEIVALGGAVDEPADVRWYKDGAPVGVLQPGATVTWFVPTESGSYSFTATNDVCSVTSPAYTVTVHELPTIVTQPVGYHGCAPSATLSVEATPTLGTSVDWFELSPLFPYVGSGTSLEVWNDGDYFCIASNGSCSVQSDVVTVELEVPPSGLSISPANPTVCYGGDLTLQASATGSSPVEFLWELGGDSQAGQTATFHGVTADSGSLTVVYPGLDACSTTLPFSVGVLTGGPSVSFPAWDGSACFGLPVSLQASVSGGVGPLQHAWSKDGAPVPGTGPALDLGPYAPGVAGVYRLTVTDGNGCSDDADLAVPPPSGAPLSGSWLGALDPFFQSAPQGAAFNWTSVCPPTGVATIAQAPACVLAAAPAWTVQALVVTNGGSLELPGGTLLSAGSASIRDGGAVTLVGGELAGPTYVEREGLLEGVGTVAGDLVVASQPGLAPGTVQVPDAALAGGGADLRIEGDLHNDGLVRTLGQQGSGVRTTGALDSSGTIELGSGTVLSVGGAAGAANTGTVEMSCASFVLSDLGAPLVNAGTISGTGTIVVPSQGFVNDGAVAARNGLLSVASDLVNPGLICLLGPSAAMFLDGSLTSAGAVLSVPACGGPGQPECAPACPATPSADGPTLSVFGDVTIAASGALRFPGGVVEVAGDFRSAVADPFAFDLSDATLRMNGVVFVGGAQELELIGTDLGPQPDFDAPALFGVGAIEVGPNPADVRTVGPSGAASHAVYVERLVVDALATLRLGDATVYAEQVEIATGGKLLLESGMLHFGALTPPDACALGMVVGSCATQLVPLPAADCDGDGVDDATAIALGEADCNANGIPDTCDVVLGLSLDQDGEGTPDDCQAFHADVPWISIGCGGRQELSLHAGAALGGRLYFVGGSASGTAPGTPLGSAVVPLVFDTYSLMTVNHANQPPFLATAGLLDGAGAAQAALEIPPATIPVSGAGLVLHHAFVSLDATGSVDFASNPTALELRP